MSFRQSSLEQLVVRIDALLPQTQCQQCGYSGCQPYANAIAQGEADINQCPPGGDVGIEALAQLLQRDSKPLNPAHGSHKARAVAYIDEQRCIGCTLCIQACPVDAILGASKQMHTVIHQECTGCELCLAPCPVDCIEMLPIQPPLSEQALQQAAELGRRRHHARLKRLAAERQARQDRLATRHRQASPLAADLAEHMPTAKQAAIAAAMARVNQQVQAVPAGQKAKSSTRQDVDQGSRLTQDASQEDDLA